MRMSYPGMLCVILLLTGLAGCGTSQPTKYYLLSTDTSETARAAVADELTIGVGPVILPPYLDRREIVTRTSSNELHVAINHQWGEALLENVSRVVREDLSRRLGTDRIVRLPLKRSLRKALVFDYQVTIAVDEFEKTPDGSVVLAARWGVLDSDRHELLLRRSEYSRIPAAEGYAAQAAAQSAVLSRLTEEITTAILELEQSNKR